MLLRRGHCKIYQYLATISANIINIAYGTTFAWFSSNAANFLTHTTPLEVPPLSKNEVTWISSSQYVGAFIGTIFLCLMGDGFGRKNTIAVLIIPQLLSWTLIMFSSNATELYIARFLSGFAGGGSIILTMLFVSELAEDKIRGKLSSILPLSMNLGILIEFIADYFLSLQRVTYVIFSILFVFLCTYTIFPDTPKQLYKINKKEKAIKSLQIYRNANELEYQLDDYYRIEVKKIKSILKTDRTSLADFASVSSIKSLSIAAVLIMLHTLVNSFVMLQYSSNLHIDETTTTVTIELSKIIIGSMQLAGTIFCTILVDRIGRKPLLLASIAGTSIGLFCFGMYGHMMYFGYELSHLNWLPILCYSIIILFSSIGIIPLIFVILPEIIPEKIRSYGLTMSFSFLWALVFICVHCEDFISDFLKLHVFSLILTPVCVVCLLLFYFVLPETKCKSNNEILMELMD